MLVEVCVQNLEDALLAEREGADRIELCASLETGGLTPSAELVSAVVAQLQIPVHVLIRPRGGDFFYSASEADTLLDEVRRAIDLGADGIVSGGLIKDGSIDIELMERVRQNSEGKHLTFHRAFDLVEDPLKSIDHLETIGIETVLTSGQRKRAVDALDFLLQLKKRCQNITILPGGGIRPENILKFKDAGFQAIHFSATSSHSTVDEEVEGVAFSVADLDTSFTLQLQPDILREMIRSVK